MRIAVCIKQVPAGSAKMDAEKGVLIREAAGSALNPWDSYAIEAALQAADVIRSCSEGGGKSSSDGEHNTSEHGAVTVTALSMGPASAEAVLREAIAMGVDEGVLLCDREFSGADVYATAYTLAQGISRLGGFDLIFCGQQTTDGDTAQIPFSLATRLNIPVAGWVKRIEGVSAEGITVLQELSGGTQRLSLPCPALLAVGREAVQPRLATLKGKLAARKAEIVRLGLGDLPDTDREHYGLAASPTRVVKVYRAEVQAKAAPIRCDAAKAARLLAEEVARAVPERGGGQHG